MENRGVSIRLREITATDRLNELVVIGVPFGQGTLMTDEHLRLVDEHENTVRAQFSTLAHWPDRSVKWTLVRFLATVPADGERSYFVRQGAPSESRSTVQVVETGETLTITAPTWRLEIGRNAPGGFLAFTAGKHIFRAEHGVVTGEANGSAFRQGTPEAIELLENGPIRLVLRLSGRLVSTGDLDLRYTTILTLSPTLPELRWAQSFHFCGGADRFHLSQLEGQWLVPEGTSLRFGDKSLSLKSDSIFSLWQKEDLTYTWTGPDGEGRTGERSEGAFVWSDDEGEAAGFAVRDFWQKSPARFTLQPDGRMQFEFWRGASESVTLSAGTSFRHEMVFALGENVSQIGPRVHAFCHPLTWSMDPAYVCETRALGYLSPEDPQRCPGYERGLRDGLKRLFAQRQKDPSYYGLLHYGDWPMKKGAYGSTWTMYADNEYDAPHALFMLFARSGRWEYFDVARAGAVHMTDVDTHCATGGMFFHGYRDNAEDHQAHRGSPGEWGHVWADGMLDHYFLTGDVTALESAKWLGDFCLKGFAGEGDAPVRRIFAGCERAVGWPLITLASLAEATGDRVYLDKARQMVHYLEHFVDDPDGEMTRSPGGEDQGHWWRILMQDGCKPFMVGVLYEGLKRVHRLTNDETCIEVFRKSLDWLIDKMWYPLRGAFEYEFNAFNAGHRDQFPHYINLLVVDGLAYTYRLTGETRYLQVGVEAFYSALWTLPELLGGKELGMAFRSSLDFLALLVEMQESEAQAPAGALAWPESVPLKPTIVPQKTWPKRPEGSPKTLLAVPFNGPIEPSLEAIVASKPEITSDGLHAVRGSGIVFPAKGNVSEIAGTCRFRFRPDWPGDAQGRPYPRTLMHIQGHPFTRDALSLIVFYNGLHLRVYGPDRRLSGVIESDITPWQAGVWHDLAFTWGEGRAKLFVDGVCVGETELRCPFGGSFDLIRVGHRPGCWLADGWMRDLEILDGC